MLRLLSLMTWLCSTLGVGLLVCSIALVPENLALGDEGDEGGGTGMVMCAGDIPCNAGCNDVNPEMSVCNRPLIKDCNQNVYKEWCGLCICLLDPVLMDHCVCREP